MERNKQVDIIRGGAILLVVLEHALGTSDNFFGKNYIVISYASVFSYCLAIWLMKKLQEILVL